MRPDVSNTVKRHKQKNHRKIAEDRSNTVNYASRHISNTKNSRALGTLANNFRAVAKQSR